VLKNRCADGSLGKRALLYAESMVQRAMGSSENVERFLAPSRFMRDSVLHRFQPEQVALLYNGVDVGSIPARGSDDGYVLYLGRLSEEKGVETLLRAHTAAKGAWPLVVAGTGPLADVFRLKYGSATFAGHLSGDTLKQTISNAAVIVLPSECFDNCPMSVLEAMAYGKPVVGSRMGGIPELVAEGETGLLFEAGNVVQLREQLDTLMASPALRQSMGQAARLRAEREFSLDKHNAELMAIYESLVNKKMNNPQFSEQRGFSQ
jgi:glycosyltransferase involved in cell wall biosynthesis